MAATIKDVAELAGVSKATVSRVLNAKGYVGAETRKRIEEAIKKLHFEPNEVARSLTVKKTKTIALFIPDITNPFFSTIASGVEDYANFKGYTLILCNYQQAGKTKKLYVDLLKKKYVDGMIFAAGVLNQDDAMKIRRSQMPMVVMDRVPDMEVECEVLVDNYRGAKQAVEHLLEIGCRKIAHIYGPQASSTARERLRAYKDAVQDEPWFSPSLIAPGNFTIEGGIEATRQLLVDHPDIDGIFAGNDLNAIGALKLLAKNGIKVPEEIAICGFDGIGLTEITTPELTTVVQPTYEIGRLASEQLIHYIEHSFFKENMITLETKLIVRESTKVLKK